MKIRVSRGITLVEVMVVIGVLGILLAVAAPSFSDLIARRRLQAVTAEIGTDLAYARSEAALRPAGAFVTFKQNVNMSCYTIQTVSGTAQCDCTLGPGLACPATFLGPSPEMKTLQVAADTGITVTPWATNLAAANNQLQFRPPQMAPTLSDFRITVSNSRASLRIVVSPIGRVSTCSPGNSFGGGVPSC